MTKAPHYPTPATPLSSTSTNASITPSTPHFATHHPHHHRLHKRTIDKYLKLQLNEKKGMLDLVQDSEDSATSSSESESGSRSSATSRRRQWFSTSSRLQFISRPSLLSVDPKIMPVNYQGIINLIILMMIVSHTRLMLENLMKYGLLVSLTPVFILLGVRFEDLIPELILLLGLGSLILFSYCAELLAAKGSTVYRKPSTTTTPEGKTTKKKNPDRPFVRPNFATELIVFCLHFFSCTAALITPIWFIFAYEPHPVMGMVLELVSIILFLKLVSYAHMNARYRRRQVQSSSQDELRYPNNIRFWDMVYYMMAPTLVYQEVFPRTPRIRKSFLMKRCLELFGCCIAIVFLCEQYILPLMENAMGPISRGEWLVILERMMKLTIPTILVWLLGFYAFFHSYLNILSEILCFGDRLFYMDFWNCDTLAKFWRTWNIPVSQWMVFHIYLPLIQNKICGQKVASFAVFLVSAVFHELVVSVPFRTFKMWAFGAMLIQMPLCIITEKYTKGRTIGNMLFWLSFLFGQSNLVCFYYRDWYIASGGV